MMRMATILFVLSLSLPALGEVVMDAAEVDMNGDPLEHASFRLIADNTLGVAPLEDPRFKIDWTGNIAGYQGLSWTDPANPWYGAPGGADYFLLNGASYDLMYVFYPPQREWGFLFRVDPTPSDPGNMDEYDTASIPAGIRLDVAMCLLPEEGSEVHFFSSPAQGEFTASGETFPLSDIDPRPQTVPEPMALILLALGGLGVLARRK